MMYIIITTILLFWLILVIKNILYWLYIWQIHEYRLDRFIVYLREELKASDENKLYIIKASFLFLLFNFLRIIFLFAISFTYLGELIWFSRQLFTRNLRRPVITLRIIISFVVSVLAVLVIIFPFALFEIKSLDYIGLDLFSIFVILYFVDLLIPFIISFSILITYPFSYFSRLKVYDSAIEKLKRLENLKVVGITGSYGKSSVKEILFSILVRFYHTEKTQENQNTKIGIAQTIFRKLTPDTRFFVAEIGAYKIGEIESICELVKPDVGILTGINEQHLSLFGSIENTVKAKFELLRSLPKNGTAVINGDDERIVSEAGKMKNVTILTFGIEKEDLDIRAVDISIKKERTQFKILYKGKSLKIVNELPGKHNVYNILAAFGACISLNIPEQKIKEGLQNIKTFEQKLKKVRLNSGWIIIDESYNSNPKGLEAALDYLCLFKSRRLVLSAGLKELGKAKLNVYKFINKKFIDKNIEFLTFDSDLKMMFGSKARLFDSADGVTRYLDSLKKEKLVILLEGRLPVKIMKYLELN